jgi:hypothetical protein
MLTRFSPISVDPARFSIQIRPQALNPFSNCVLHYDEPGGVDHDQFDAGLKEAAYAYMGGLGWDRPVDRWFSQALPSTTLDPGFVTRLIAAPGEETPSSRKRERWPLSVTS